MSPFLHSRRGLTDINLLILESVTLGNLFLVKRLPTSRTTTKHGCQIRFDSDYYSYHLKSFVFDQMNVHVLRKESSQKEMDSST